MSRKHLAFIALPLASVLSALGQDGEKAREQERQPIVYREFYRQEAKIGDRKVTLVRVQKPNLPLLPRPPAPPPPTPEQEAISERRAAKEYLFMAVTATVYVNGNKTITELRWRENEREFTAYSNVDFRYLTQITDIETDSHVIQWFPFVSSYEIGDVSKEEWDKAVPQIALSSSFIEYAVDMTDAEMKEFESSFAGLDELHAHYSKNAETLKRDYLRREKENADREEELRRNPPKEPDTLIHFWPVKSRLNSR